MVNSDCHTHIRKWIRDCDSHHKKNPIPSISYIWAELQNTDNVHWHFSKHASHKGTGPCTDDNTYCLTFTAGLVGFNGVVEHPTLPAVSCVRAVWAVTKSASLNNVSISTAIFRKEYSHKLSWQNDTYFKIYYQHNDIKIF